MKDSLTIRLRHKKFIKTVCDTNKVIGLKNNQGFSTSSSIHYEDNEGQPISLICFWSKKEFASLCVKDGWIDYLSVEISLSDFMENWCIGMDNDGLLVGTEFDNNMFGFEIEPLELILEIIACLKANNKTYQFKKFKSIEDFENQVKSAL